MMENVTKRPMAKVRTTKGCFGTPVNTDLNTVFEKLRSGDNEEKVARIANCAMLAAIDGIRGERSAAAFDALPYLIFGVTFGKDGLADVRTMTHLVLLSISFRRI